MKNKLFYGLGLGLVSYFAYKGFKEGDSLSMENEDNYKGLVKLDNKNLEESLKEFTFSMERLQGKIQELKDSL